MGGRMVVCGATSGADPDIDIRSIYQRHRQIRGEARRWGTAPSSATCCRWWPEANSATDRPGTPLEQIAEGHRAIENRAVFGKVVLRP